MTMTIAPETPACFVAPETLERFVSRERDAFIAAHPRSRTLADAAGQHFLFGVPMHWMRDWPSPTPLFIERAQGARLHTADGSELIDFCLGDTGAMFGHSPAPIARALAVHAADGLTAMLPSVEAAEVGRLLSDRFGLPCWQLATTASDANRFVLRWARAVTGRPAIIVFDGCYHGTVDDTLVDRADNAHGFHGVMRPSLLGQVHDLSVTTRVVEFNDVEGLRAALADHQVACVITEPVLTNIGMVLPEPGFLEALRQLTRDAGTLLVLDETHTISCGPGGYTRAHGLAPDMLVLGKPIAGGCPAAVYGFTAELAQRMARAKSEAPPGHSGIGTTLTAGLLPLRLMRVMLDEVMSDDAYAHMFEVAHTVADGLRTIIARYALDWSVTQIGARCEYQFRTQPPRTGREAEAAMQPDLESALHLALLNRGVLLTPFHNMVLCSPAHTRSDAEALLTAFDDALQTLLAMAR
ncbi:MAG: aspartate aminotransferase family protein [Rhodocyclaceae bacterium]